MTRIDCWSLTALSCDPYTSPECIGFALVGVVTGHPKRPDGEVVRTSRIVGYNGTGVETASGTVYELGSVDPSYERQFPGARERLLARLAVLQGARK